MFQSIVVAVDGSNPSTRAVTTGAENIETSVEVGNPADKIIAYAKSKNADLIVMGRRGLSPIKSLLLGSTSHKVNLHAECNCLTVI